MNVYIANFGRANYEWPRCLADSTIAVMHSEDLYRFYRDGDRNGFINWAVTQRKTARGLIPTRSVASRWYGSMEIVEHTEDDVWIHRANEEVWWTTSLRAPADWKK